MALFGRAAIPSDGVRRMANDPLSAGINEAEAVLCLRISGAGNRGKAAERDGVALAALRPDRPRQLPRGVLIPERAANPGEQPRRYRVRGCLRIARDRAHGSRMA
jgi:hypothetical protein